MDSSTDDTNDRDVTTTADSETDKANSDTHAREVEVPLRLYKVVTVFSTLFAVGFVVGGFIVLDTATQQARLSPSEANVPLAILGVAMIAGGALVYAFATRFRAEGMGKPKDQPDEQSNNG